MDNKAQRFRSLQFLVVFCSKRCSNARSAVGRSSGPMAKRPKGNGETRYVLTNLLSSIKHSHHAALGATSTHHTYTIHSNFLIEKLNPVVRLEPYNQSSLFRQHLQSILGTESLVHHPVISLFTVYLGRLWHTSKLPCSAWVTIKMKSRGKLDWA